MKHKNFNLSVIATIVLLTACGGGGGSGNGEPVADPTETPSATATPSPAGTPTPSPSPSPSGTPTPTATPTPTPTACVGEAISFVGPSRVFKGCDAANVATYYDITECVRDSTGLIWEGKTPSGSGGLRDASRQFTDYDDPAKEQVTKLSYQTNENPYRRPTNAEISASTNSIGYQNAVNATRLCGLSNWRRPTLAEFTDAASDIQTNFFPNVGPNKQFITAGDEEAIVIVTPVHKESLNVTFNPFSPFSGISNSRSSPSWLMLVHQDPNIPRRSKI
ncbi:MAG: hypothetical protein RI918_622 [Pseudomonadota bacterium]